MSEAFRTDLKAALNNFCFNDLLKQNFNCFMKRAKKNQSKSIKIMPKHEVASNEKVN